MEHDVRMIRAFAEVARADGYAISVFDGGEWSLKSSRDVAAIVEHATGVDEATLLIRDARGRKVGTVFIVNGNSPGETIADFSDNELTAQLVYDADTIYWREAPAAERAFSPYYPGHLDDAP